MGLTWSAATPIEGTGCARPRLLSLGPGRPTLMSGGRMCWADETGLFVWLNPSGMPGAKWERYSLSYAHNQHWTGPDSYKFDERINGSTFFETQAYTSLMQVGDMEAVVTYNLFYEPSNGRDGCYTANDSKVSPCSTGFSMRLTLKHDDDAESEWSPLKGLPTLPKPHHSWLSWAPLFRDPTSAVTQDLVRITGSCSVYACFGGRRSCDLPSKPCQNDTAGRAAVEACVALAKPHNATIAINFSPWYCAYKRDEALSDPTNDSPKAKEQEAAEIALWKTNLGKIKLWLEGRAAVSAVLVDSERFECAPKPTGERDRLYATCFARLRCSDRCMYRSVGRLHYIEGLQDMLLLRREGASCN